MIEHCYHINHFPLLDIAYVDEAFGADYSYNVNQYTDETKRLPESLHAISSYSKTMFIQDMAKYFDAPISDDFTPGYSDVIKTSYWKILPGQGSDWPTDISRNCAINILLNGVDGKCVTLFRNKNKNHRVLQENWALEYKLYMPVLINTQVEHMVANWSLKERYLLTIGLPKRVNYQDAKEFLKHYVPY